MSETAAPQACPEPVVLARYAGGTLDLSSRAAVERHIAECGECAFVIAETVEFLEDDGTSEEATDDSRDEDPRRLNRWWLGVAAMVAAVCIPLLVWRVNVGRDPLYSLRSAAASSDRPMEGMLEGFTHRAFSELRTDRPSTTPLKVRAAAERTKRMGGNDAAALHARGIADLMIGNPQGAVASLGKAVELRPDRASYWNDLAVAQLAAGAYSSARRSSERAIALAPSSAAAHFNHAVALEKLGQNAEAIRAYEQAASASPPAGWRDEIDLRIAQLSATRK